MKGLLNFHFLNPLFLLAAPLVWAIWFWLRRKKTGNTKFFWTGGGSKKANLKMLILPWLDILLPIAFSVLILAMARPIKFFTEEKIKADGIDIMMSIDLSSSMLARDFTPDRLEVCKILAVDFVQKRKYDRIGLVVFAGESFTQSPVTTNHDIIKGFLANLQVGMMEDGTAIGMGLATSVNRLKNSVAKSKVIILLTDGVNNSGFIDPTTATEMAKALKIKVYTIGVGTNGIAISPISKTPDGEYIFGANQVNIDEELLQNIAAATSGKYFRAQSAKELKAIYDEIDTLEKTEIEVDVINRQSEAFRGLVILGLFLLMTYYLLLYGWIKKYI